MIASAALAPEVISVGGSGALFGLYGAFLGDIVQNWERYNRPRLLLGRFSVFVFLQLLLGTLPLLDSPAHVFGFLMGLLCALSLLVQSGEDSAGQPIRTTRHQRCLQIAGAWGAAAAYLAGLLLLGLGGAEDFCPVCNALQCLPAPWGCDTSVEGACWWDCAAVAVSS
ncbi:unnamed protein product [Prorocentrum cordatum]|nr:unnamed protein product [Polarella glacialis]